MAGIERLSGDLGDALGGADDLFADRMIFVQQLQQAVIIGGARAVLAHADFLADDALLFLHGLIGEEGRRDKMQQKPQILFKQVGAAEEITGHVRRGKGVRIGPVPAEQAQCAVAVGQVEHLMLEKVRDAGRRVVFGSVYRKAPVGPAVIRGKHGIKAGKALFGKNPDTQTVFRRGAVQDVSRTGVFLPGHHDSSPPSASSASSDSPAAAEPAGAFSR